MTTTVKEPNGTNTTINANAEIIALVNSDTVTINGSSDELDISGGSNTALLNGNEEIVDLTSGAGGNTVTANGQSGNFTIAGGGNTFTVNGTGDTLTVSGSNNALYVNGASDNKIYLSNYNNVLNTGNALASFADNSGGTINGGGNNVTIGSSDTVALTGDGVSTSIAGNYSTMDYQGSYGALTITGSSNTATIEGNTDTVTDNGASNNLTVTGLGERLTISGINQHLDINGGIVSIADNAVVTFDTGASNHYSNGNIIDAGKSATITVNGSGAANDWVQAASGDTITLNGQGDGVGGTGAGNTVSFTSTNEYALISNAALNLASGAAVTFTGNTNTVSLAASATLIINGNNNAVTATGTGNNVTIGGSGDTISMSGGTLTLNGTGQSPATGTVFSTDGFAYPSYSNGTYATAASANSLQSLAATGANAVELVVTQYVASDTATTIATTYNSGGINETTESDANLELAISQAQAKGLQVLLKPHIDIGDGSEYRAYLAPSNVAQFFSNYKTFIVHYAQIAQTEHVGMLSLGAELASLTGSQYYSYWADIIAAVRQVYTGKLTYSSAWFETHTVSFWNLVDVIGANPYENPTQISNPTVAQLDAGWNSVSTDSYEAQQFVNQSGQQVSPVAYYQGLSAEYNKPILFTEIGYRSVNGATLLDGNYAGYAYEDFQQQSNALEAFFETFSKYSGTWLQGAYLWDWNPDPTQVVTQDFSVQGKPALNVVDAWYGPAQIAAAPGAATLTGNANTTTVADGHTLAATGSNNSITGGTNVSIAVSGNNNTVTAAAAGTGADMLVAVGNGNTLTGGAGNDTLSAAGTGNILIGGGGIDIYEFNAGFGTVTIENGATGNTPSGTLQLGPGITLNELLFIQSGNDLQIEISGSTDEITVQNWFAGPAHELASIQLNGDPSDNLTTAEVNNDTFCFYPGTSLATPTGAIAVEDITPGTILLTSNGPKPVRWLGRSTVSTCFADPLRSQPIRIKAGALPNNLPLRDLLVSPDHALFLDNMLIQASALINHTTITREAETPAQFIYYHIEMISHELVLAEGSWAETFIDHADRMSFDNWSEYQQLIPIDRIQELPYPRCKSARQLPTSLRPCLAA